MDRLISEHLLKTRLSTGESRPKKITTELLKDIFTVIDAIPPAESDTGHWIYIGNKDILHSLKIVECDKCHKRSYGSTKFCPNCGIKMDKNTFHTHFEIL